MFGCLRRLGCLVVLLVLAACAYVFRDRWMPLVFGERGKATAAWTPVRTDSASRSAGSLEALGRKAGPVYANFSAAEIAALILDANGGRLPTSVRDVEAMVQGEQVHLRGTLALEDIKGLDILGPFGDFVGKRERFALGGTLDVVSPGTGEFRVTSAQVGDFPIPSQAIPKLLGRLMRGSRPAGLAPNGIPFTLPSYVGDIRVGKGRVTLYKNVT